MATHSSTLAWKIPWIKNLPAVQKTSVQSLGWEDPLEREMETHSSTLAWKIPWTEEPGRLHPVAIRRGEGAQRKRTGADSPAHATQMSGPGQHGQASASRGWVTSQGHLRPDLGRN